MHDYPCSVVRLAVHTIDNNGLNLLVVKGFHQDPRDIGHGRKGIRSLGVGRLKGRGKSGNLGAKLCGVVMGVQPGLGFPCRKG